MKERSSGTLSFCQSLWVTVEDLLGDSPGTRAGTPPQIDMGGRSVVTTAPAPTTAPSPMDTPAVTTTLAPSHTSLPDGHGRVAAGLFADKLAPGDAVIRRDDRRAGPKQYVAANGDCSAWRRPDGAQVIDEAVIADVNLLRVLEERSGGDFDSFAAMLQPRLADVVAAGDEGDEVEPAFDASVRERSMVSPGVRETYHEGCAGAGEWTAGSLRLGRDDKPGASLPGPHPWTVSCGARVFSHHQPQTPGRVPHVRPSVHGRR